MDACGILLATDGSAGADMAVALVASSLDPRGVALEVVSVVPSIPGAPSAVDDRPALVGRHLREAAERIAQDTVERLVVQGFDARPAIRQGHPADVIVELADVWRPDMVVLGTRGLSGLQLRLSGSVSTKVARYAPVSVLVARTPGPVRQILLGYDASPDADEALARVAALPWNEAVEATVCSAYDVPRPLLPGVATTMVAEVRAAYRDVSRWAREAAEVMAAHAARRLTEQGIVTSARTARGKAYEQLAVVASELPADLLVVGSRGLSAIQRFFLGSTSATLLTHPPTSVLVARGGGDRP